MSVSHQSSSQALQFGDRGTGVFASVLVGIDGSPEALEASRQASALAVGRVELLATYDIAAALVGGTGLSVSAYYDEESLRSSAENALEEARREVEGLADAGRRVVRGTSWGELIREVERSQHTLVAVGSHGQGRLRGILLGSTATELIHKAPCSVLVARTVGPNFPRRIVVGVDGSPESAAAYGVARHISERFSAALWPVVAHGGEGVDKQLVAQIVDYHHEDLPDEPVPALISAAVDADLVVVGSRGLHGLKSLGSVSERVAHQAHCSTLVVRERL